MVKILLHHLKGGKPASSLECLKSSFAVTRGRRCARACRHRAHSQPSRTVPPALWGL